MSRASRCYPVWFFNPPVIGAKQDLLKTTADVQNISIGDIFTAAKNEKEANAALSLLMDDFIKTSFIEPFALWYCGPAAIEWTRNLNALVTIYDCTEHITASPKLSALEQELLRKADLVFTSGQSLYQDKFAQHPHVFSFPNSVSTEDFAAAKHKYQDPEDQKHIPHPRLGYFGRINERIDFALIKELAELRPDWQVIFVGPLETANEKLPRAKNLHFLGEKAYEQLPAYLAGWDVALVPFISSEYTKFLNPEKTAEYLAAGTPVVSTEIPDMLRPYACKRLVRVAGSVEEFIESCQISMDSGHPVNQQTIDDFLRHTSWDETWAKMQICIDDMVRLKTEGISLSGLDRDFRNLGSRLGTHP